MTRSYFMIAIVAGAAFVALNTLFIVHQTQQALVLQFGKPVAIVREPGLKAKIPFMQNVVFFDKRILEFNADSKEVIASDQKRMIVDAFVRYRITDPLKFFQTARDERTMQSRLNSIVESSLRQAIGSVPLNAIISPERSKIMGNITRLVNSQTSGEAYNTPAIEGAEVPAHAVVPGGFGIEVLDVRIMRADLPSENSQAIFRRMQTEREREAKEFRAQGEEEAQRIRSKAERERTVLLAEAKKQADIVRGEGDAEAIKVYADAFGRDPAFFDFYRSMEAYRSTLKSGDTTMILSPESKFLKEFSR